MNDHAEATASDAVPTDFEDEFDSWLGGATISKRSVPIYAKPGLFAEYEDLQRERDRLEAENEGEPSMGDSRLSEIDERVGEIHEEWVASKSVWVVRALGDEDYSAVKDSMKADGLAEVKLLEEPEEPDELPEKHSLADERALAKAAEKFQAAKARYDEDKPANDKARTEFANELNIRIVSRAVVEIRFASGNVTTGITVERLRTLREKLGQRQILSLMNAASIATYQEPEIPANFSRRTSEDDQT